jgi:exodeoxyribonuclease VII small subunit
MMMSDNTQDIQAMDFETAFNALQENVAQLESEDLPLEKPWRCLSAGRRLPNIVLHSLEEAELKVRTL